MPCEPTTEIYFFLLGGICCSASDVATVGVCDDSAGYSTRNRSGISTVTLCNPLVVKDIMLLTMPMPMPNAPGY
ncbi:hypothetical protein V6N13_148934 [Hibiscus sabdariffa]